MAVILFTVAAGVSSAFAQETKPVPPPQAPPAVAVESHTAPAAAVAAPRPAPALKPVGDPVNPETKSDRTMGFGGWMLVAIGVVVLFVGITLVRRRRISVRRRSITDFSPTTAELKLQPGLSRRP